MNVRINVLQINSFTNFCNIRGGINGNMHDVYFVRQLGCNDKTIEEVKKCEMRMKSRADEGGFYLRVGNLPMLSDKACIDFYTRGYETIKRNCYTDNILRSDEGNLLIHTYGENAFKLLYDICTKMNGLQNNVSLEKNFIVKVLFWLDSILKMKAIGKIGKNNKIVFENISKKHEYLFTYFLCLLGCDICLLQTCVDIEERLDNIQLSWKYSVGMQSKVELPVFSVEREQEIVGHTQSRNKEHTNIQVPQNRVLIPEHPKRKKSDGRGVYVNNEKSFEELANLASSVVMISVHTSDGEIISTGSGIMVGEQGYILTNCHVISGGNYFSVRVENDENIYSTDEIIKYHNVLDLALIRIPRKLIPLPIYNQNKELVRGQKVVAIGSPLGLFNSVSDGIISGFRNINEITMMQFTAPISSGSSGGAVLNMQGQVIGISAAGIDTGQNLNLAVIYHDILNFLNGFI